MLFSMYALEKLPDNVVKTWRFSANDGKSLFIYRPPTLIEKMR